MERLVLLNTLRLHTWKVSENASEDALRDALLRVRGLGIRDFILYTSTLDETRVLDVVRRLLFPKDAVARSQQSTIVRFFQKAQSSLVYLCRRCT